MKMLEVALMQKLKILDVIAYELVNTDKKKSNRLPTT